jgi:hypothetical protein
VKEVLLKECINCLEKKRAEVALLKVTDPIRASILQLCRNTLLNLASINFLCEDAW